MRHLDEEGLVDAAEGRLDAPGASHLDACAACQLQVRELRAIVMRVGAVEDPAPSPLFWEHFRTRIFHALVPSPVRSRPRPGFGWLAAGCSAVTVALVILAFMVPSPDVQQGHQQAIIASATPSQDDLDDIDADEAWALVRTVAADLEYEDAREAGVAPAWGALDRAALELSAEEQNALVRLLEEAMKRTDS